MQVSCATPLEIVRMSDETVETLDSESSAERLLSVGAEVKKRRGRPPGSKNKPRAGDDSDFNVSTSDSKKIFAGALIGLFALLGIALGWFGYEKIEDLTQEEAEEGGKYLLPISQKIGWIAVAAFYLSFPAWLIVNVSKKFRKKPEVTVEAPRTEVPGVSRSAPVENSLENAPDVLKTPLNGGPDGFSPISLDVEVN
jgi:hypothetical protein